MKKELKKNNIFKRFKDSIYTRSINPKKERDRIQVVFQSLALHLHPTMIPEKALKFSVTWGLGGMAALLILLQALTGILLRFVYQPFPGKAYDSIIYLKNNILFGDLIRNFHHWSGTFLVLIVFLHLLRVYFTGAYHDKRQFNWVLGVFLLLFVIFSNFTGYLLPWDQLAFWAITVSTSMLFYVPLIGDTLVEMVRGGSEIGEATLLIFYNFHTSILPLLLLAVMGFHFWRVRKAGGVVFPKSESDTENKLVTTLPHLIFREFVVALILIAVILLFSIFFDAPLLEKANPAFSPNPAKAPWYFEGLQELMLHFHPLFAAIIIPTFITLFLISLPYLKYDSKVTGIWFLSDKGKQTSKISAFVGLIITPSLIIMDEYFFDFSLILESIPPVISNGLFPFTLLLLLQTGYYKYIKIKYTTNKAETIQAMFVLNLIIFLVLTLTSILFRGEGMALTLPWN
ncbi:MAG: cytochrome b N-terminal domain-containing protein [Melioribacteraceae bacterium]|nr:cytochrome b N-terminal domain-containing protein [Melioribacteraceae bacterium]